jgi:hypothetical protein
MACRFASKGSGDILLLCRFAATHWVVNSLSAACCGREKSASRYPASDGFRSWVLLTTSTNCLSNSLWKGLI